MINAKQLTPSTSLTLDYLRGISAILVLIGHARRTFFPEFKALHAASLLVKTVYFITSLDSAAVTCFFVVSGYLIGGKLFGVIASEKFDAVKYSIDRLSRLYVVLIPALIIGAAFLSIETQWLHMPCWGERRPILSAALESALFMQNSLFSVPCNNGSLWSLANEFWYYLLFPLLLISVLRRSVLAIIGSMIVIGFLAYTNSALTPHSILLAFPIWMMGAGTALLAVRVPRPLSLTVMLIMLVIAKPIADRLPAPVPEFSQLVASYAIAFSICLLLASTAAKSGTRKLNHVANIGSVLASFSYSLYLTHLPFINFIASVFQQKVRQPTGRAFLIIPMVSAACLIWAFLNYLAFERQTPNVRSWLMRLASRRSNATPIVVKMEGHEH